jgi:hypothetical protein
LPILVLAVSPIEQNPPGDRRDQGNNHLSKAVAFVHQFVPSPSCERHVLLREQARYDESLLGFVHQFVPSHSCERHVLLRQQAEYDESLLVCDPAFVNIGIRKAVVLGRYIYDRHQISLVDHHLLDHRFPYDCHDNHNYPSEEHSPYDYNYDDKALWIDPLNLHHLDYRFPYDHHQIALIDHNLLDHRFPYDRHDNHNYPSQEHSPYDHNYDDEALWIDPLNLHHLYYRFPYGRHQIHNPVDDYHLPQFLQVVDTRDMYQFVSDHKYPS